MAKIDRKEKRRLEKLKRFEKEARVEGFAKIAGVDEVGRGPLAGPVLAAACILPEDFLLADVDDSKKLTAKQREELYEALTTNPDVIYGVGIASHEVIDAINIYQAIIQAMFSAVDQLSITPDLIMIDGMKLTHKSIATRKIVDGDSESMSIACASIIAKVTRDRIMSEYHHMWPHYGFDRHKGYGTACHLEAIAKYGPCPIHRLSFEPFKSSQMGKAR